MPSDAPRAAGSCPYLGLEMDPTIMLSVASEGHRCHAVKPVQSPRVGYQRGVCLGPGYVNCAKFKSAAHAPVRPYRQSARPRRGARVAVWLLLSTALLVAVAAGLGATGVLGPYNPISLALGWQSTPAPQLAVTAQPAALAVSTLTPTSLAVQAEEGTTTTQVVPTATSRAMSAANGDIPAVSIAEGVSAPRPTSTPTPQSVAMRAPTVEAPTAEAQPRAESRANPAVGEPVVLKPAGAQVGWWRSSAGEQAALGDSFLNSGRLQGDTFISAFRLPITSIPRGAPVLGAEIRLTGLNEARVEGDGEASWLVELIGEKELATLNGVSFMMLYSAPNSITLRTLKRSDLGEGVVNTLTLDEQARAWLEQQRIFGATGVIVRIVPQIDGEGDTLFAWDSGVGPKTSGAAPVLSVVAGAPPPTPPPVPTEDLLVATFTPAPQNVLTLVAVEQTATAIAQTTGTYTPVPPFATPTTIARSVETVQAVARDLGAIEVVLETPVPLNEATATANAAYATAVALTTGTYTPVPTAYVTPMLVIPSPPAQNAATEVARIEAARDVDPALVATLPYNAVLAAWASATPQPENVETAAAVVVQMTANAKQYGGAPPTPWGQIVYTPFPTPLPTPLPTIPVIQAVLDFTPTPELAPTATPPSSLPREMANMIIFKSFRINGLEATFAYDPATAEVSRINAPWAFPLAEQQLGPSPDGKFVAFVKRDGSNLPQVHVRSVEFGSEKQITNFSGKGSDTRSYDAAWSPTGEWIAFASNNSGNDEIYRVTPDGSIVEQLTFNSWEWDKHPTWSPDGTKIVFYSNRDTKRRQLWIMNADGSDQKLLFSNESEDWDPVWTR